MTQIYYKYPSVLSFQMTNTMTNRKPIESTEQIVVSIIQYLIRKYNGGNLKHLHTTGLTEYTFLEKKQNFTSFRTFTLP